MPKFNAPQTHNVIWLHPNGVSAYDRETGEERPFFRYAFRLPSDDPKVVHIGAVQTHSRTDAVAAINMRISRLNAQALWNGSMLFEELGPAMKAWRKA